MLDRRLVTGLLLLLLAACGGGGPSGSAPVVPPPVDGSCIEGNGPPVTVGGQVLYQRLVVGSQGLGPALEVRPSRFIDVQLRLANGGTCYGLGSTDDEGFFSVVVRPPAGSTMEAWVYSRTDLDPLRRVTLHNALPPSSNSHTNNDVFYGVSDTFQVGAPGLVDVLVPYNPGSSNRPSIGFGALDVLLTCSEAIRTSTGIVPPHLHAYTRLGNNGATGTSFYTHAARAITFLGGAAGNLDGSDTDYFDEAVIAHEFGHFVEFNMANSLNRGGPHGGEELEPGFSWSEGQCTGFGCLCRKSSRYIDSLTTTGAGNLIDASVENWSQFVRGIGGEATVAELVWDLGDGAGGIQDLDGDLAAVGLADLYGALLSFAPALDAPYIGLYLDRLVDRGAITGGDVATLLLTPENQQISYPLAGDDVWPIPIAVGGQASDVVDSTVGNACRGIEASRWYAFTLASQAVLTADLAISPIAGTGNNLDLELTDFAGARYDRSAAAGAVNERIGPITLAPGKYIVRVEANCSGAGNRAGFTLTVSN